MLGRSPLAARRAQKQILQFLKHGAKVLPKTAEAMKVLMGHTGSSSDDASGDAGSVSSDDGPLAMPWQQLQRHTRPLHCL